MTGGPSRDRRHATPRRDLPRPAAARPVSPRGGTSTRVPSPRRSDPAGPTIAGVRITPIRVMLAVALIGSLAFIAYTINVREAEQIPMLASGAAVLGIVFVGVALGGAVEAYRSGSAGDGRRAVLLALAGGFAAMIAAGCFAGALVLALVWSA